MRYVTPTCEYCAEFEGSTRREEIQDHLGPRSRLARFSGVLAFPSVSPLRVGHVLIAPRRHTLSLRMSYARERAAVREVAERLAAACSNEPYVFFEHGVGAAGSGGCGIVHAHAHAVPLPSPVAREVVRALDDALPAIARGPWPDVLETVPADSAYVSFGPIDNQRVYDGATAGSQLVRRLVAGQTGRSWDWREFSRWSEFDASLSRLGRCVGVAT